MPETTEIWVHWKGRREGPYTPERVDTLIARREISSVHRLEWNGTVQSVRDYVAAKAAAARRCQAARAARPKYRLAGAGSDLAGEADVSEGAAGLPASSDAAGQGGAEGKPATTQGSLGDEFAHLSGEAWGPVRNFFQFPWLRQGRTVLLLAVILPPSGLFLFMDAGGWGREWFWGLSGYLTVLWMILFGLILRPDRGAIWKAIVAYAGTVLLSLTLWALTSHSIPEAGKSRDGFQQLATVTVSDELCKLLTVAVILVVFRKRLSSRDALYLGFVSGLGLGIVEGIYYQARIDERMSLGRLDYYNNLALVRLVALPLLQAVWTATAAYFFGLAARRLPRIRYGLIGLALLAPMGLHAAYDSLSGWPALVPCAVSVLILMIYAREAERAPLAVDER